jgi:hypothetical protein
MKQIVECRMQLCRQSPIDSVAICTEVFSFPDISKWASVEYSARLTHETSWYQSGGTKPMFYICIKTLKFGEYSLTPVSLIELLLMSYSYYVVARYIGLSPW